MEIPLAPSQTFMLWV